MRLMKSSLPNGHSASLRRIQLSYDNNDSDNSVLRLAYTIKPKWREDAGDMEVIKFTDGITNTVRITREHASVSRLTRI